MNVGIGVVAAFGAGLLSFLSPCVLPLIPAYLSFLGGIGAAEGEEAGSGRAVFVHALLFVAGFTLVFVALGASASALGALLSEYRTVLTRVSGVVVFLFGFLMLGIIPVPWLYREARFDMAASRGMGIWTAPVMGAAFGFGWTPCVGPILGSILAFAAQGSSVGQASGLLLAYSLGLAVPFLVAAATLSRIKPLLRFLNRKSRAISIFAGAVLMVLGVAIFTGQLERLAALFS